MTWIKFALWLTVIYAVYYAAIILWDFMRQRHSPAEEETHELTFIEHNEPHSPDAEAGNAYSPSAVITSGGVSLKQLFMLARQEAIEFTRPVSF